MARIEPVIATLSAADTWSAPVFLAGGFNISVSGTFSATARLQRSFDDGASWLDVADYTAPAQDVGEEPEGCLYRIGLSSYTSGAAVVRLGQ